jgi:hypothetical protein
MKEREHATSSFTSTFIWTTKLDVRCTVGLRHAWGLWTKHSSIDASEGLCVPFHDKTASEREMKDNAREQNIAHPVRPKVNGNGATGGEDERLRAVQNYRSQRHGIRKRLLAWACSVSIHLAIEDCSAARQDVV